MRRPTLKHLAAVTTHQHIRILTKSTRVLLVEFIQTLAASVSNGIINQVSYESLEKLEVAFNTDARLSSVVKLVCDTKVGVSSFAFDNYQHLFNSGLLFDKKTNLYWGTLKNPVGICYTGKSTLTPPMRKDLI